jgi:hypothetical protein
MAGIRQSGPAAPQCEARNRRCADLVILADLVHLTRALAHR